MDRLFKNLFTPYSYEDLVADMFKRYYTTDTTYETKQSREHLWVEKDDRWEIVINSEDADITLKDEKMITVTYEKVYETDMYGKYKTTTRFSRTFPENSLPETLKAKRSDGVIYISVNKAFIATDKFRKIEIE